MYIFIKKLFTSVHYGKLIGTASMVGGVFSLTSNCLYNALTMRQFNGEPGPVMWGLCGAICASYLLLVPMFFAARKKQKEINSRRIMRSKEAFSPAALSKISMIPSSAPDDRA